MSDTLVSFFHIERRGDLSREVDETPDDIRELALAHKERDRVATTYNRATLIRQRRALMDRWAAFCYSGQPRTTESPSALDIRAG